MTFSLSNPNFYLSGLLFYHLSVQLFHISPFMLITYQQCSCDQKGLRSRNYDNLLDVGCTYGCAII